ncbi:TetR/AcrR family transcriptional regulator [Duganella levis]|uniref:TetR family transcriptional regulator n=1 Tax=Duganella levis TaxID=2692169 RepID=A0ABW9W3K8_9BURK|nr:TetR/AcrR family transcriptional regulator [Duganella levis]MYN28562.1 TetR family transcriptional regulator [Duganella levis]
MAQMGRPRQFDRDQALTSAMHLFWENGYEATSLSQLKTELGISAPSFYAAFGSKEALFQETVALYLQRYGTVMECLWDAQLAPRVAIETALRASARMQCGPGHPKGCMVALGVMSAGAPDKALVTAGLTATRARNRNGLLACVRRGIEQGELASTTNPTALAAAFESFLVGLSTLARDGTSPENLDAAVTNILLLWDCARK